MDETNTQPSALRAGPTLVLRCLSPAFDLLWGAWWGGLTFYAAVVVPIGTSQFGSVEQGFLTQQVTVWLNVMCGLVIVGLTIRVVQGHRYRLGLVTLLLALVTGALVWQHSRLSALMDPASRTIADGFYPQHALYLWLTTAQWLLGLCVPFLGRNHTPR